MSDEIFEKDDILTDEELEDVELGYDSEEDDEESGLAINLLCFSKWKKKQTLSILDFSSLSGTISSVLLISVIVLLVKYIKLKKHK